MKENSNPGIESAFNYSLLQAISRRRSRRIGCGFQVPHGALQFKSGKQAQPLTAGETALLCYSGAGMTGLTENADIAVGYSQNVTNYGRAYPSACNAQHTYLLYTNDEGVFIYWPRPPQKPVQVENLQDLKELLGSFDQDIIKLQDGRLDMPTAARPLLSPNIYSANQPGQTVFITLGDMTYELINIFLINAHFEGNYLYDDLAKRPVGDPKWIDRLKLHTAVPLSALESFMRTMHAEESGFITQNILLMSEAMGLGAWTFAGFNNVILMGGSPFAKGLNFRFVADHKGNRVPVGIDNSPLKAHCPPYYSMEEAVDSIIADKFGPNGFYDPERRPSAFKEPETVIGKVNKIPDDVIECVKDWCGYIYDTYGRFPATVEPMIPYLCVGVTHLDIDFYNQYYRKEIISETIREHMGLWHPGEQP